MAWVSNNISGSNSVTTGEITVNTDPYSEGVLKTRRWETTGALVIPPGAYKVSISPAYGPGESITVNGEVISFDGFFSLKKQTDNLNKTEDFTPQVEVVNPSNFAYWVYVEFPSSNPIDVSTL